MLKCPSELGARLEGFIMDLVHLFELQVGFEGSILNLVHLGGGTNTLIVNYFRIDAFGEV